ncbi:MAG TPA: sugar phosphate isomerase/epimerase family protein [Methanoregulaceae archaeon]|nr:MAG: sugar phosphate isomerase/epimerase [Methanolinea sp.]HON81915.1 sugar phosphate isomerase/epimerase family protein [Methanoregulaceae archaeon]HPD10687.1 sugar phosphate isomerase/epimerase family protein [Methanoregulaceae archaeon]HRT15816.1 sugar phosphate isomerase/epimerase family protein [Methanoregulaceae archaeon]HRU31330.1 sugar phosphate isomerase/epimerase family protein [Methanoregulaceae archaeon]
MVRLAVSSMFFHEYPLGEIFDFVAEAGLDTLEFWIETPHFWLREQPVDELTNCMQAHPGFSPLVIHAPVLDLNPCSINPRVAEVSVRYTLAAVEMAELVGADVLTVHPGRRTAKRQPSAPDFRRFEYYIRSLRGAVQGKRVRIAIENMERKVNSLLCSPEMVREVLDREPWLWFTLDVSHALGQSVEEVFSYIDLCSDRLATVHLGNARGTTMHLPVSGSHRIAAVLHRLDDAGFSGTITLEIEDLNFDHDLSPEEKILFLREQAAYIRSLVS